MFEEVKLPRLDQIIAFLDPEKAQHETGNCISYELRVIMVCPMYLGNMY